MSEIKDSSLNIDGSINGKVDKEVRKLLKETIDSSIVDDSYLVMVSKLEGEEIKHDFFIGKNFKTGDITVSVRELTKLANNTIDNRLKEDDDSTKSQFNL